MQGEGAFTPARKGWFLLSDDFSETGLLFFAYVALAYQIAVQMLWCAAKLPSEPRFLAAVALNPCKGLLSQIHVVPPFLKVITVHKVLMQ